MTTLHPQLTNALSEETIPPFWVAYFRENFRSLVQDELLESFEALKRRGFSRAALARKLGRRPEQITRWLSAPNNMEIDTISDIALALGCVPRLSIERLGDQPTSQLVHPLVQKLSDEWKLGTLNSLYARPSNEVPKGYLSSGAQILSPSLQGVKEDA